MTEEWRDIPGYEGRYQVSKSGEVRSLLRKRAGDHLLLSPNLISGYRRVHLQGSDGKASVHSIHILVLRSFVGERPAPDMEGSHCDGNSMNNKLDNLRWATRKQNQADRVQHGTSARGSGNGRAALCEADIPVIRRRLAAGERQTVIAEDYGVTKHIIYGIAHNRTWRHVA